MPSIELQALRERIADGGPPLAVHSITFPKDLAIVVLAPHPDDFDAIAVTLRAFRDNGNAIHLGVLSSSASGVEDSFCSPSTPEVKAETREEEQRASCRLFGLPPENLVFLRLEEDTEGQPVVNQANAAQLRQYLTAQKPDLVFLPHGNDTNAGHRRTYAMLCHTVSAAGTSVTAFLNRDPKTIEMRHDLYTPFEEEEARWKARLLQCHQSQHQRNLNTRGHGIDERILRVNRQTARDLSRAERFAEVFELTFLP